MNTFEQVSSDGHQMSLARGQGRGGSMSDVEGTGLGAIYLISRRGPGPGSLYSEVQCIMVMVTWGPPAT